MVRISLRPFRAAQYLSFSKIYPNVLWSVCLLLVMVSFTAAEDSVSRDFSQLVSEIWEFDVREDPLFATHAGDHRYNDKLPRMTEQDCSRRHDAKQGFLKRLAALDRAQLDPSNRANFDILQRLLENEIAEYEFRMHYIPITNRSGFHITFPELRRRVPFDTVDDYEDYIARLEGFDRYATDHIQLMRRGIETELTLPSVVLEGYQTAIEPHVVDDPASSLLYEPFQKFPHHFSESDRKRFDEAGRKAIEASVVSGYQKFLRYMENEYVPAARGSIGASALPRGREFYRYRVRKFTTLDLTPDEVHTTGLSEVDRIRTEMQTIIKDVGFQGDFSAFVEHLRSDPQFYAETAEQLMKEVAYVLKRMDGQLPNLFGKLPRAPYGIREVPEYIAPNTTTAYYSPPAGDGSRAGFYYVNTYDLKSRPLYAIEALSLHEAVPGHHLQLALQQELRDLPRFRRFAPITAFIEGWGLYAERLGLEVGFYEDPYRNFGRLNYEMWRACRLVVDTGIHYFGWTRKQAIDYMLKNTALAAHNIRAEVDRYISWPGQALAYKIGELKIRELRKIAEQQLGDRFDIREFHDVVLGAGAVPLDVLEEYVLAYVHKMPANHTNEDNL